MEERAGQIMHKMEKLKQKTSAGAAAALASGVLTFMDVEFGMKTNGTTASHLTDPK
jgi:hypothetical protein